MLKYWKYTIEQYANFKGRASRQEFIYFHILDFIILFLLGFSYLTLNLTLITGISVVAKIIFGLSVLVAIYLIIPRLSILCRRLHDINLSGWWYLILLIPYVGLVPYAVLFFIGSYPSTNKWGANPKTQVLRLDNSKIVADACESTIEIKGAL